MKHNWIVGATMVVAVAALGGCASGDATGYAKRQPIDQDYVNRTMALARRRGVDIVWVHPPLQKADAPH